VGGIGADAAALSATGAALLLERFSGDVLTGGFFADALMVDRSWLLGLAPEAAAAIGAVLAAAPARSAAADAGGDAEAARATRLGVAEAPTATGLGFAAAVDRTALPTSDALRLSRLGRLAASDMALAAGVDALAAVVLVAGFDAFFDVALVGGFCGLIAGGLAAVF
jgi:hypothetical protein